MLTAIPATTDEAAVHATLEKIVTAFNNSNVDDLLALHTNDFVLMDPGKPTMYGSECTREVFARFEHQKIALQLRYTIDELEVNGRSAFVRGKIYSRMIKENTPAVYDAGRFLCLFRKHPKGHWLRSHVMVNRAVADK